MKQIAALLTMVTLYGCAFPGARTELILMTVTNHTSDGAIAADSPQVQLGPYRVPAYNESNWGLAIGQQKKQTWWMAGTYRNSFWTQSAIGLAGFDVAWFGPYRLGLGIGAATGYGEITPVGSFRLRTDNVIILFVPNHLYHLDFVLWRW